MSPTITVACRRPIAYAPSQVVLPSPEGQVILMVRALLRPDQEKPGTTTRNMASSGRFPGPWLGRSEETALG